MSDDNICTNELLSEVRFEKYPRDNLIARPGVCGKVIARFSHMKLIC